MSWNELSLTSIGVLCASPDLNAFVYFVDNVVIGQQLTLSQEAAINGFAGELQRYVQIHGIKLIKPLKRLLIRLLERSIGYSNIFTAFLRTCENLNVPSEAFEILEYPTFFKGGKQISYLQFLLYGIDIYIQLRKYSKAYELSVKAVSLLQIANELIFNCAKRYIVLCITLHKHAQFTSQIAQLLDNHHNKLLQDLPKRYQQQLNFYLSLQKWRPLNQAQTSMLLADKLLDAYKAGEFASLRVYIQNQIKGQNWRIRAQNIRDISIGDFSTISKINSSKSIYRYDCKQKIMYFNHKLCDQDKINELISKSFIMQNELRNLKEVPAFDQSRMMGGMAFREVGGKRSGPGGFPSMGRSVFDRRF